MIHRFNVPDIMTQYTDLFADELDQVKDVKAHADYNHELLQNFAYHVLFQLH